MPENPKVELEIVEGHLKINSNLGDQLKTVQFLLGVVSLLMQGMKVAQQEEPKIIVPHNPMLPVPYEGGRK